MKKKITVISIFIIIALLIALRLLNEEKEAIQPQAAAANMVVPAEAYFVRDTTVAYQVVTVGSIRANEMVDIVSEMNRKVVGIYLKEGSVVTESQLLFRLDDEDLLAKLEQLKAAEELAITTESRERARLEKGGISQQRYDEVAYQLKKIQANIKALNVDISKTTIKAPFSGKVGLRNVSIGAYTTPNAVLANLQDISKVKIDFAVPERYASDIKINQEVSFTADYSDRIFKARVDAFEPAIDTKTRTLLIRAVADNSDNRLVPGSSVKVNVHFRELNQSIFIPSESLIPTQKGYQVYLVKNGQAQLVEVKTGMRTKDSVQILQGIAKGDTVITTNLLRLRPKTTVKVIKLS
ncbi:efflux RND transporter periplasmic adaptor subunit [candidate division KSB1 bacterium]|nr:efflux RND transporter periplasmic adaptor subunit [candidate division KSB1 bacterium]